MSILDIGSPCIDRSSTGVAPSTLIDTSNPVTASGKITNVAIWANVATTITKVAIFDYNGDNKFTARCASGNLGAVTPGSVQNFAVDLDAVVGDFIGIYFTGGKIELGGVGSGIGLWHSATDETTCNNKTFSPLGNVAISVYGTGLSVTTQSPTSILETTATGRGTIVGVGGANATVRGFKYGLTQTDTWSVSDNGTFSAGAYTKGLTSLIANTTYWIRAYFTCASGTYYSGWIQFQTAASATIPTGTRINICSDFSGYTDKLMRAETDDGNAYTAYFVISTDLTNKQGLSFYKRILDLHLYFMSESSGTATVEVKRDNEASWQSVGTVSLTGTEDIIIEHLAPDIRGKVFLFKISSTNFFRFLGVLFEYLPEDLR